MLVTDYIAERLASEGVRFVFGVGGANIEDLFAAVQRQRPRLRAVLAKHEHGAGTAADAYARLTGGLGAVMTTSGGGAMNVVHALAEAKASRVPLLAIVGEPPTELQGRGAFQDTSGQSGAVDAAAVFRPVSVFCQRIASAAEVVSAVDTALAAARGPLPGPAVLLIAKDLQGSRLDRLWNRAAQPSVAPVRINEAALQRAVQTLASGPIVVIAGAQVARARATDQLARLVERLDAQVCVTPDGRDAFDNADARFAGVAGAMGHRAVTEALSSAGTCVLVGTRLPFLARMGLEALVKARPVVALARETPFLSSSECVHLGGDLRTNLERLLTALGGPMPGRAARGPASRQPARADATWSAGAVVRTVSRATPPEGVVLVDAGNTGAEAAHHAVLPSGARWLMAMGMAGMGWSFGAAIGAACATGQRCTVLAGDGAFFMHGLEVHTAIEHGLPITFVIFNNRAHGMCLVRERLLLGGESGTNSFGPAHIGAGLAAMFPGLAACDCTTVQQLETALARARDSGRPAVIVAELPSVDVPPFLAFGGSR